MKAARVRLAVLVSVLVLAVMGYFTWAVSKSERVVKVGQTAPNLRLPSAEGTTVSLDAYRGEPVILDFFTTWCGPCQTEAPSLERVAKQYKGKVLVIMVDRGETSFIVNQFMTQYHLSAPTVLIDKNDHWASRMGVTGQPETFLIDRNGVIQTHINYEMSLLQLQTMAHSAEQMEQ